jgi:fructokinase
MIDVVAMGEMLIDFTYQGADADGYPTMAAHPGGAPANFLAALSKFGIRTAILAKVGNDKFGKLLVATAKSAGIEIRGILVDDNFFTTLAFVTLDEHGNREFSFARKPGADTQITFEEMPLGLIDEAKIFHFGTLSLTNEPARTATQKAAAYARARGKLITFDPNLRKPLWASLEEAKKQMLWGLHQADVVKISDEEIGFLFGCSCEDGAEILLRDYGVSLVFVTQGKQGCLFSNGMAMGHVENFNDGVKTVDTTGAGDIFGGSAISRILRLGKAPGELTLQPVNRTVRRRFQCAGRRRSFEAYENKSLL